MVRLNQRTENKYFPALSFWPLRWHLVRFVCLKKICEIVMLYLFFVCLFVRLTDQQFLSVMLSWMCCAIQNINKPQRPEDQIKEAAQLVAAHSLKKYYESKNLRTLCYIYLLLHYEISLFFHVTGPWWVLNPTKKLSQKLGEDVTFFSKERWGIRPLFRIWAEIYI